MIPKMVTLGIRVGEFRGTDADDSPPHERVMVRDFPQFMPVDTPTATDRVVNRRERPIAMCQMPMNHVHDCTRHLDAKESTG